MQTLSWQEIFRDRMGFPDFETGPYVSELRVWIREQVEAHGMRNHSYGSWVGNPSHEERAKALLAWRWAQEHGHFSRVENLDGWMWVRRSFRRREYKQAFWAAWAIPADWIRARVCDLAVLRDKAMRRRNPYLD